MVSELVGSQRLLQIAVNKRPELIRSALRRSGALGKRETIEWVSPLSPEGHREYRDMAALERLQIATRLLVPLKSFWPAGGPVWDALAIAGSERPFLVEAKAHIPEAASPASQATPKSLARIQESLIAARRVMAPRSKADWSTVFYQYANRLAFQLWLTRQNAVPSTLIFLYFTNAIDMDGPTSEEEWEGATRLIHAVLGLPADLSAFGVYHAYLDAKQLMDAA